MATGTGSSHYHRQAPAPASARSKRTIQTIASITSQAQSHYNRNPIAIGGEGVELEIIFIIAIHKPVPQKFLQLGSYLLLEHVGVVRR